MYVWGREHQLRAPSTRVLELAAIHRTSFFTDAEVLQELLHRYRAIGRWEDVEENFGLLVAMMAGRIEPMASQDVELASELAPRYQRLSARDLVHVAVMHRVGSTHIVTADRAFDGIEGITRLDPMRVDEWQTMVTAN